MTTDSTRLLQSLGFGVRVHGAAATTGGSGAVAGSVASGQFADLLKRAQSGELASSRPVTVAKDAGVRLSEDQLAQISLAADKAEVAGVRTALVVVEGQAVTLDVANRTVTGAADLSAGVLGGIDGFINLSDRLLDGGGTAPGVPLPGLPLGAAPSLAALLGSREPGATTAGRAA